MDAVGDQHLVARVIILGHGSTGGDAVLLVTEDVLDAKHDAPLARLHRGDPARLALADDVGKHLRKKCLPA